MSPKKRSAKKIPPAPAANISASAGWRKNYWPEIALGFIILFVILIRLRLLGIPLERDEGEYAYFGQLILKGIAPYLQAYNMKFPGTYYCYAVIEWLFGQSITAIHLGLLIVNISSILFVFLFARRLLDKGSAVIAAGVFALTSLSYTVLGFAAHATHFVIFFALAGILLLYQALEKNNLWLILAAGILSGMSYLAKQSGIFFTAFTGMLILIAAIEKKPFPVRWFIFDEVLFGIGTLLPFVLTVLVLWHAGALGKFYFWTFKYASAYGTKTSLRDAANDFSSSFSPQIANYGFFWILALVGMTTLFWFREHLWKAVTIALFALCSCASVCVGLLFRSHYFVQALPALGIGFAALGFCLDRFLIRKFHITFYSFIKYLLFMIIAAAGITRGNRYLFRDSPMTISRMVYGSNPFPESLQLAQYLKEHTSKNDRIAIFGSEPQIYFYSDRQSASGYIYTYSLMEDQPYSSPMQREMAREVEKAKPEYLLLVYVRTSWLVRPQSDHYILNWMKTYEQDHYSLDAAMDMTLPFGNFVTENVNSYRLQSKDFVLLFKRKNGDR